MGSSADSGDNATTLVEAIAAAVRDRRPLPAMACQTIDEGYRIQRDLSKRLNNGAAGDLKAGVTAAAVQQHLGLAAPLAATLYAAGRLESGCTVTAVRGQELECEIAVATDSEGKPIGLMPAVEIVYLAFSRTEDQSIPNAVAANLGADRYICGQRVAWDESLTEIPIRLRRDGVELASMTNDYSFGSPASGAAWLVDEARQRGLWQDCMQQRTLLLGTCGSPIPAEPGQYQVEFGPLGTIEFEIVDE